MSKNILEKELIDGLVQQNSVVLKYIYQEIGPRVKSFIIKAGGNKQDAEDIFQEGVIAAYINIKTGKYQKEQKTLFSTYLIQICKYKWFDILKSAHKKKVGAAIEDHLNISSQSNIQDHIIKTERYTELHNLIDELGDQCKDILNRFYWTKESILEISKALNMVPSSVKNGKYRCMQKLKEIAKNNKQIRHF